MAEWKPTGIHGYRPRKGQFRGWIEALKRYRLFLYGGREREKKKKKKFQCFVIHFVEIAPVLEGSHA